jgi:hypothetical protein
MQAAGYSIARDMEGLHFTRTGFDPIFWLSSATNVHPQAADKRHSVPRAQLNF